MTRPRAALLLGGMFVLGFACGALGVAAIGIHRLHHGRPSDERIEQFVLKRLTRRLELDPRQQEAMAAVIHTTRLRLEEVHDEVAPRIDAILDDAYHEILPTLDPGQQKKLEAIRGEAQKRLHRHRLP